MLYESPHLHVEAADGVATLWLEFPSSPVNALTPTRLAEFDRGLSAATANPHIEILVIRSGRPAGFCGGSDPATDLTGEDARNTFALAGQRVLTRLAAIEPVTVALLEGPCLGPGLELALACDYRLAVAGPDSRIGFPDAARGLPPCWGGPTRLKRLIGRRTNGLLAGTILTAREAKSTGLIDDAFCARRAKIELRTFLDRLQRRPRKRQDRWRWSGLAVSEGLAAERTAFREALRSPAVLKVVTADRFQAPYRPLPDLVGVLGTGGRAATLAVEAALRGTSVAMAAGSDSGVSLIAAALNRELAEAIRRGRATPLEAEQARARIRVEPSTERAMMAGWVIAFGAETPFIESQLRPRTILTVPADLVRRSTRPERVVGLIFPSGGLAVLTGNRDRVAEVAAWIARLGFAVTIEAQPTPGVVRLAA